MFGVGVDGLNLNDPAQKYFDVEAKLTYLQSGHTTINSTTVALEACTSAHWNFTTDT